MPLELPLPERSQGHRRESEVTATGAAPGLPGAGTSGFSRIPHPAPPGSPWRLSGSQPESPPCPEQKWDTRATLGAVMKTAPTRQGDLPRKADTSEVPEAARQHTAMGEAACRPLDTATCPVQPDRRAAGPRTVYRSWMRVLSPSWISRRSSAVLGYG